MTRVTTKVQDLASLKKAQAELGAVSTAQKTNIAIKTKALKSNFFLKTNTKKYDFNAGQSVYQELLLLATKKIFKPKTKISKTIGILLSTFLVQNFGKKIQKKLNKFTNKLLT